MNLTYLFHLKNSLLININSYLQTSYIELIHNQSISAISATFQTHVLYNFPYFFTCSINDLHDYCYAGLCMMDTYICGDS